MWDLVVPLVLEPYTFVSAHLEEQSKESQHTLALALQKKCWYEQMFGRLRVYWSAAFKALNFWRAEGWKGEAGGGQGAHPYCLPGGSACCTLVLAVPAYRSLTHHAFTFEVKPPETWVEIKGSLKTNAMHGVFFRGENKGCCFSDKAMSPLEAAATRATPTMMVCHGGRAQPGVPRLCTLSKPCSLSHSPSLYPSPPVPTPVSWSLLPL